MMYSDKSKFINGITDMHQIMISIVTNRIFSLRNTPVGKKRNGSRDLDHVTNKHDFFYKFHLKIQIIFMIFKWEECFVWWHVDHF